MGRFFMLMVAAVLLATSYLLFSNQRTNIEAREEQSDYQFLGIARDNVESGFDRGVSAIKRDLMDVATTFPRSSMDDGYYDLSVIKHRYGNLDVIVDAYSGDALYQFQGNVIFTAPLPSAFIVEDDVVQVSVSGDYQISGVDRRINGMEAGAGFNNPVRGIITTEAHATALSGVLNATNVVGIGGSPDDPVNQGSIIGGYDEDVIEALYQDARSHATNTLTADPSGNVSESSFLSAVSGSSEGNPAIIRAKGNLTVNASLQGYGMLIVEDGDLKVFSPHFDWQGIVMVRKEFQDTVAVDLSNTSINGGFIAYDYEAGSQQGLCVPNFEIVDDEVIVNDPFALRVEVVGAAITAGGAYDIPVTARVNVGGTGYEPWGSYDLALDGNVNTGNTGITYLWEPTDIFPAGSTISLDARSWRRAYGTDGTEEGHWFVGMEEHSSTASPQIYLLEDADAVPGVGGFMGQYSVEEFLDGLIVDDQLVLDANQSVGLFELGMTDTESEAFDLQDLVVVITMIKASESGCVPGGGTSRLELDLNDAEVHYSSEAIAKLGLYLDVIRDATDVRVTESMIQGRQEGESLVYDDTIEADDGVQEAEQAGEGEATATVCHNGQTATIPFTMLSAHLGHGDTMGACATMVTVCHNGRSKTIPPSAVSAHLGHGDTIGACSGGN